MSTSFPFIFIVCSPRSGSTWLRKVLGDHPEIAAGEESGLFTEDGGLKNLFQNYHKVELPYQLNTYIEREQFYQLVRDLAGVLLDGLRIRQQKRFLVEKTPAHALQMELINSLFPEARFIYLVRDGRDVTSSIIRSGKTWYPDWPTTVQKAAGKWFKYNRAVLEIIPCLPDWKVITVRYEDLRANTLEAFTGLFQFIGVSDCTEATITKILENNTLEIYSSQEESQRPRAFWGNAKVGQWRTQFDEEDIQEFKEIAGGLLIELGYEKIIDWN